MKPKELICRMPQFEDKSLDEDNWMKIPEKGFLLILLDTYEKISPVLATLIKGGRLLLHPQFIELGFDFSRGASMGEKKKFKYSIV